MRICCISAKKLIVLKLHKKWAFFALEINRCKKLFKRIKCYSSMILIQSECSMSCYICWSVLGWGAAILHASAYRKFPADFFFCFHSISVHFNFFYLSFTLSVSFFHCLILSFRCLLVTPRLHSHFFSLHSFNINI